MASLDGRPILCLVSDRRRLAGRGAHAGDAVAGLIAQVREAGRAGVDLVQIRERDLEARALVELVTRCLRATVGTATRIVVNDRLDVALIAGAAGVHLRGDSFDAPRVRTVAPRGFLVGRSVHSAAEAAEVAAHGGVDYLFVGSVFASASKPLGSPTCGIEELARAARSVDVPVLGIGGITDRTIPLVARAGAAGVAAIGLFVQPVGGIEDPDSFASVAAAAGRARSLFEGSCSVH